MRILIGYSTKTGTTADCAHMLGAHFAAHEIVYADLAGELPELSDFDVVMIGSPIRMGRISVAARDFLRKNEEALAEKPYGLFLCCGFPDNAEDYLKKNFSASLLSGAASAMAFGGESRLSAQKGLDKLIMKWVLGHIAANNRDEDRERDIPYPAILPENIRRFADEIKGRLGR